MNSRFPLLIRVLIRACIVQHLVFSSFSALAAVDNTVLSAQTDIPEHSTYILNEPAHVRLRLVVPMAPSGLIHMIIKDEAGRVLNQQDLAPPPPDTPLDLHVPTHRYGYYRVEFYQGGTSLIPAQGSRPAGFISYAVVADPNRRTDYGDRLSRFGLQGGFNAKVNIIPLLGIRRVFQAGSSWSDQEPDEPGTFAQQVADKIADAKRVIAKPAASEDISFHNRVWATYPLAVLTNGKLPPWALDEASRGHNGIGPQFSALTDTTKAPFADFSAAHAREFSWDYPALSQRIYQVTWEPMFPACYGGTSPQLAEIYKIAAATLHANDPRAVVAGPTLALNDAPLYDFQSSRDQLHDLIQSGLASSIDLFTFHAYYQDESWPIEKTGFLKALREQVAMVRDAAQKDIPFASTEHGFKSSKYGDLNQALATIRSTILLLGEGAQFVINFYVADFSNMSAQPPNDESWGFYWNLNPNIISGTDTLGPKPVVPAYAAMTLFLDGATSDGPVESLTGTQMGYRFHRDGATLFALWDYGGESPTTLPIAGHARLCDWMGNCAPAKGTALHLTLKPEPVYVLIDAP